MLWDARCNEVKEKRKKGKKEMTRGMEVGRNEAKQKGGRKK